MAYSVQSSSYNDIILAVQQRLADAVFDGETSYVYIGKSGKPPGYPTEKWLRIVPGSLPAITLGGGRRDTRVHRNLSVELYTRFEADVAGDSVAELTDLELGYIVLEETICNYLHLWTPMSNDDVPVPLLFEPMRLTGSGSPPKVDEGSRGRFVTGSLNFDTAYLLKLEVNGTSGNGPS